MRCSGPRSWRRLTCRREIIHAYANCWQRERPGTLSEGPDERALSAPAPLSGDHELDPFNSGTPPLDDWLKRRARQNEAGGASRTYVIAEGRRVVGYYSLAAGSVLHAEATGRVRRNMPDPVPAALLGRLAIDQAWQGRGLARRCCATPSCAWSARPRRSACARFWCTRFPTRRRASTNTGALGPRRSSR